jgi:hypothetical protein
MNPSSRPSKTFFGVRKLPAAAASWVMPLILSILMTFEGLSRSWPTRAKHHWSRSN